MPQLTHKMGGDSVITNTLGVLFTDGTEQLTAATSANLPWVVNAGNYTFANSDNGSAILSNQASNLVYTMPTPTGTAFVDGWYVYVKNGSTTNTIALTPTGATIDGMAVLVMQPHTVMLLVSDGTNYHSLVISAVGNNTANLVFASPNGASGSMSARPLVQADMPTGIQTASVTLTSAQLLALSTTPITIVPAPGAGFYIAPSYGFMQYHFGGTAYTSPATGNDCYLLYGPPPEVNPTNLIMLYDWAATASGIIKATASATFIFICGEGLVPYTTCNNAAVVFTAPNALGAGNGTLTITLNYQILPLP